MHLKEYHDLLFLSHNILYSIEYFTSVLFSLIFFFIFHTITILKRNTIIIKVLFIIKNDKTDQKKETIVVFAKILITFNRSINVKRKHYVHSESTCFYIFLSYFLRLVEDFRMRLIYKRKREEKEENKNIYFLYFFLYSYLTPKRELCLQKSSLNRIDAHSSDVKCIEEEK